MTAGRGSGMDWAAGGVRGEDGRVLGVYVPAKETVDVISKQIASPYTDAELDRWAAEPGGRSLAEILADLRSRS